MSTTCPKCGYTRQPGDTAPDYECPKCGVIYAKARVMPARVVMEPDQDLGPFSVAVADVSMPFWSMVRFMVKWALASIPAVIILAILFVAVSAAVGGLLGSNKVSAAASALKGVQAPVVTRDEYAQLKEGMSYRLAQAIIGQPGEEVSRSEIAGYTTVMYAWSNPDGSNMNAMFQNDQLVNKAQLGLR